MESSILLKQCGRKDNCIHPMGCWQPATEEFFHKDNSKSDKLCTLCRYCKTAGNRRWQRENPDKVRQADKNKKLKNPETYRAIQQRYRDTHAEQCATATKLSEQRNPLMRQAATMRRVARRKQAEGTYSVADIKALHEQQCDLCGYCGIRLHGKFEIDHIYPLSRGGSNWPDNLLLACTPCNKSKQDKTLEEWALIRGW